ncbi:MAG TPA: ABC transporter permease [Candidatus Eremiobacteraceae bacterium]|nr:ABC transporter permease [Candidatus Eremiobacteraceae bacterium]
MPLVRQLAQRVLAVFRRGGIDRELDAEISSHLALAIDENLRRGMSPDEARRQALIQFGGAQQAKENHRDARTVPLFATIVRDLRFAVRLLRKSPGFTLTVILTLALAVGANTAIFSIVNALLLKSLPYAHPERIGTVYQRVTGSQSSNMRRNIDGEQWDLLRDDVPLLLSAVSSLHTTGVNLQAGSHVQYLQAGRVSAHYFAVLSLQPIIGRNFSVDEDRPHGPKAAILSYPLWKSAFDANSQVVGQPILLKGEPYTVIGVLPQNATTPLNADLYTPLQPSREGEGQATNFHAIMRLRDGASWQQADAEMNRALARSARVQQLTSSGAQVSYYSVQVQKAQNASLQPQVLALMLAASFILLIACANLAGLTLVQMLRRTPEIATRQALGASRWQIQRQLWTENALLGLLGAAAGIGVGFLALRGLLLLLPEHFLPVASVSLDNRVLGFTLMVSLSASVLFGLLPALTTRKTELRSSLGSHFATVARSVRLRQALIAGEVALTAVLLTAAGLVIHTLIHLESLPPGFNPNGIVSAKASLDDARFHDPAAFRKLLDTGLAAMRQIPGVQNAAVGLTLPYERAVIDAVTLTNSKGAPQQISTDEVYVTPDYFGTLQIPVLAGRAFADFDNSTTQPVVIINDTFARKFFSGTDAVGRYLTKNNKNLLIVGVVATTVGSSAAQLTEGIGPLTKEETIYVPAAQIDNPQELSIIHTWIQPSWIVRTATPIAGLTGQMQQALASADPNLPFSGFYDIRDLMASTLAMQRIEVALLGAMAFLALLLSAVGLFALVANMVVQRTREISIRIALGSTLPKLMVQVGRSAVAAAATGLLVGLIFSFATLRVMRSILYGISVYDPPAILLTIVVLCAVVFLASLIPVLRVARIDPAVTLREE